MRYILDEKFIYLDIIHYIIGIMLVNEGSTMASSEQGNYLGQINIFLLYLFIKFGDWYYSKETNLPNKKIHLSKPKIPISDSLYTTKSSSLSTTTSSSSSICPICTLDKLINPTTLSCCGIVYCNGCLTNYMRTNSSCFNCKNQIKSSNIIKIYK